MIRIGLLGEDSNDTSSIQNLLLKNYKKRVQFFPLVKNLKGHQLDTDRVARILIVEFKDQ